MAQRITSFPNDIPVLNTALMNISDLQGRVAALESGVGLIAYNPRLTAIGGSYTNATAKGYYATVGSLVYLTVTMYFKVVGAGTYALLTLPFQSSIESNLLKHTILPAAETAVNGFAYMGEVGWNNRPDIMLFRRYDGVSTIADGSVISVSGWYPSTLQQV